MTARKSFIGLSPSHTRMELDIVPTEPEQLSVYLDKQFTVVVRSLNSMMSGGAYTPQSMLPEKLRDGDIYYFPFAIAATDIVSGGLWQWNLTRYSDNLEIVEPYVPVWQNVLPITKPVIARP
jgi:hypothetical protein